MTAPEHTVSRRGALRAAAVAAGALALGAAAPAQATESSDETTASTGAPAQAGTTGLATLGLADDLAGDDGIVIVAVDPGHGGDEPGAVAVDGTLESALNWKIANALVDELRCYDHVRAFLTKDEDETLSLADRTVAAVKGGADLMVSCHNNASGSTTIGTNTGAEVWAPCDSSYNLFTHEVGTALGEAILPELEALGQRSLGVRYRLWSSYSYPDGSTGDYYGLIRTARLAGISCVIVEHAYVDNEDDYATFLASDESLWALGAADAAGVAAALGASRVTAADVAAVYDYDWYVAAWPDVAESCADDPDAALVHFLRTGMSEGRQACEGFSPAYYKAAHDDLRHAFGSVWEAYFWHYVDTGQAEGRAATGEVSARTTMWRLYNPYTGEHLYTASDVERNYNVYLGWDWEGVAWDVPEESDTPVWRLYNPYSGDHHYTTDKNEYDVLGGLGWTKEGVSFYSVDFDPDTGAVEGDEAAVAVLREYNPYEQAHNHNFTTDLHEHVTLVSLGWVDESWSDEVGDYVGAWYALDT